MQLYSKSWVDNRLRDNVVNLELEQ